jgi:hypothetical protein
MTDGTPVELLSSSLQPNMNSLSRSPSQESRRSRSHSNSDFNLTSTFTSTSTSNPAPSLAHTLSASSVPTSPAHRKGRFVDLDATIDHADRASISMPPPPVKPEYQHYPSRYQTTIRRSSRLSGVVPSSDSLPLMSSNHTQPALSQATEPLESDAVDSLRKAISSDTVIRRSDPETESNRMSFSSLYGSVKNALPSGPSSIGGGSDQDGKYVPWIRIRCSPAC